jgi:hypothetical protein
MGVCVVRKYAVFLGAFSLFLVACGVPEEQYGAVVAERDSLQSSLLGLEIDLDALTTQNHMNAAKIDVLESTRVTLSANNLELAGDVAGLEDTLETVITQNDTLEIDLDALTTQNRMNVVKIDELESTRVTLSANNLELAGDVAGLEVNIYDMGILNSSFETTIEELGSEVEELTSGNLLLVDQARNFSTKISSQDDEIIKLDVSLRLAEEIATEFETELAELRPLVDDEALLREMGELRVERDQLLNAITTISTVSAELEGGAYPSSWSKYACTRSMAPLLDCGDVGIYLNNPTEAQIGVGDVLAYWTPSVTGEGGCQYSTKVTRTVHRVVAISTLGMSTQYQTRGDANVNNDLCWVPHASVRGKLIRAFHDVRPEDDILVEEYDLALNKYRRLQREYNELLSEYEDYLNYYNAIADGYYSGVYSYNAVTYAYNLKEDARIELNALISVLNKAGDNFTRIKFETFGI